MTSKSSSWVVYGSANVGDRLGTILATMALVSCASIPTSEEVIEDMAVESTTIKSLNENPDAYAGKKVLVHGSIQEFGGEIHAWEIGFFAAHNFGPARAKSCVELVDPLVEAPQFNLNAAGHFISGRVKVEPAHNDPAWCPSDVIVEVETLEPDNRTPRYNN